LTLSIADSRKGEVKDYRDGEPQCQGDLADPVLMQFGEVARASRP